MTHRTGHGRPDTEPHAEVERRQFAQQAGSTRDVDLHIAIRTGPARCLEQTLDAALDVEAPLGEPSLEEQALCFMAGANSIFAGDKLLTTPNPGTVQDQEMFQLLQLKPRKAYKGEVANVPTVQV